MQTRRSFTLMPLALAAAGATLPALAQRPEPYRVAVLASLTGPLASLGVPSKAAIDIAAKKFNDAGGLNGRQFELIYGDDQSDPSKGVIAFKRLLDDKPVAMIGPNFSSTALGIIPLVEQARLPMITMAAEDTQVAPGRRHVFMISLTTRLNAQANLGYLKAIRATNIALLHDSGAYGRGGQRVLAELAQAAGISILQTETFNLGDADLTPQLTKIRNNAAVQALVMWGAGGTPAVAARQFRALDFKVPLVVTGAQGDPGFAKAAGPAAENLPFPAGRALMNAYLPPDNPSKKLFDEFNNDFRRVTNSDPNVFAAVAHDAFRLLASALAAAPGGEPEKLVAALEATRLVGVNGEYAFGREARAGMLVSSIAMGSWKDGRIQPTSPNCEGCYATVPAR